MMIQLPIFASICWLCGAGFAIATSPTVRIKNGTLEGIIMTSRKGKEFSAFRNIPFAKPPIGRLRFEPPQPLEEGWIGAVRSAKEDGNLCMQFDVSRGPYNISEDCLNLNVYTPRLSGNNRIRTNYPVMVWIYGGGWTGGAAHSKFYGPKFLLDHDIVLVTINYRLGPLGFLSTEDLVSPGNQGMKDQVLALRWVQENIASFGGDPNRVTIFGESAGAISAHLHSISPLSRGLFHRGISQSGVAAIPNILTRPGLARNNTNLLGKLLLCPTEDSTALVECLRTKNASNFVITDPSFLGFKWSRLIPFRSVIEPDHAGAFLREEPTQSLKCGNVVDVPWLMGINSQEGAVRAASLYGPTDKDYVKNFDENFNELLLKSMLIDDIIPESLKKNVTESIRHFYLGNKSIDESTRMIIVDMGTDAWFLYSADEAVKYHREKLSSSVYYYQFAYRGSSTYAIFYGDPVRDYGVAHGDELQYLFPVGQKLFPNTPLTENDYRMVDVMTSLWTNFARTGDPTPTTTTVLPVKWRPVSTPKHEYLNIDGPGNMSMKASLFPDRVNFWRNIPTNVPSKECRDGSPHR